MKILWLTWKDLEHPLAGGAELVNEELAKRLAFDGHEVRLIVGGFPGGLPTVKKNGYHIIRLGNRITLYWKAYVYYLKNFQGWADLVIDEINTIPFLAKFYVRENNILFIHMLCRQIWFFQLPLWIGWIGYLLEPLYLGLLRDRLVVTVSESTKQELIRFGFSAQRIAIISEGTHLQPIASLTHLSKRKIFTLLSLGQIRPMKQTHHQIKAFEIARQRLPELKLIVAGEPIGNYGVKVLRLINQSPYARDIEFLGKVSTQHKNAILRQSHLLLATSIKEGWGLTVTEAASQGTPSVVYDADGLRDSVKHDKTGYVCQSNSPELLASGIVALYTDTARYNRYQQAGWEWSKTITFDRSYQDFSKIISQ